MITRLSEFPTGNKFPPRIAVLLALYEGSCWHLACGSCPSGEFNGYRSPESLVDCRRWDRDADCSRCGLRMERVPHSFDRYLWAVHPAGDLDVRARNSRSRL